MKIESMDQAKEQLDRIDGLDAKLQFLRLQKQQLIDAVMTEDQLQELLDIDAKFEGDFKSLDATMSEIKEALKPFITEFKGTIHGEYYQGIFRKGYPKFNTKKMEELLTELKETAPSVAAQIAKLRTMTKPSVSFKVKAKSK